MNEFAAYVFWFLLALSLWLLVWSPTPDSRVLGFVLFGPALLGFMLF